MKTINDFDCIVDNGAGVEDLTRIETEFLNHVFNTAFSLSGDMQDPCCVLLRIMDDDDNIFRIVWGYPRKQRRHDVGGVGLIKDGETVKSAIHRVIRSGEILVINEARTNEDTRYMIEHIMNKGINSIAYVPILLNFQVRWIAVFDKIQPNRDFSEDDCRRLRKLKHKLEKIIESYSAMSQGSDTPFVISMLNQYAHEFRNHAMAGGGFARRILEKSESGELTKENLEKYIRIVIAEISGIESDLKSFVRLFSALTSKGGEQDTLQSHLDFFMHRDYRIEYSYTDLRHKVPIIDSGTTTTLFLELLKFINENGKRTDPKSIQVSNSTTIDTMEFVHIRFSSIGFDKYKEDYDARIGIINMILAKNQAFLKLDKGSLTISLPLVM